MFEFDKSFEEKLDDAIREAADARQFSIEDTIRSLAINDRNIVIERTALEVFEEIKLPIVDILNSVNTQYFNGKGRVVGWKNRRVPSHIHREKGENSMDRNTMAHFEIVFGHKIRYSDARIIAPDGDIISVFSVDEDTKTKIYKEAKSLPIFPKWEKGSIPVRGLSVLRISKDASWFLFCGEPQILCDRKTEDIKKFVESGILRIISMMY